MGREINPRSFWETLTPTNAPMAIASAELMSRLRKSTRCSKNDILPPGSCSAADEEGSDCGVVIRRFLVWDAYWFRRRVGRIGIGVGRKAGPILRFRLSFRLRLRLMLTMRGHIRTRRFAGHRAFRSR